MKVWEHFQNLANSVEAALGAYETWTSWTPTFTTGPLLIGSGGTREGSYQQLGKLVHAEFRIELGSGFTLTAGTTWEMVLPVAAITWAGAGIQSSLGSWMYRNNSVPTHYSGTIGIWAPGATSVSFGGAWDGTVPRSRISNSGIPVSMAAGDVFSGNMTYRAA